MDEQTTTDMTSMTELASEIVAAYVMKNHVQVAELPELIRSVRQTLGSLNQAPAATAEEDAPKPAVPIKKSVTDDYLISLFDGRRFKSLKRHLSAEHGITPDEYRTIFGLPKDYPMVAPAYAKQRSSLAKSLGLGRKAKVREPADVKPESEPEAPKKRSRAKATV